MRCKDKQNQHLRELSLINVDKVLINGKSMFTITKWGKIAGEPKIVNLTPRKNHNLKKKSRWVE